MGWRWVAGYVGGRALNVWKPAEWQRARTQGFDLLPIWVAPGADDAGREVGTLEGQECVDALQARGLSGIVVLDVEDGLSPEKYAMGFVDAVHAGSCEVVLYGTGQTLNGLVQVGFDFWWLAQWPLSGQPVYVVPPDWTLWQFGTGPAADYNVAQDDFPFATLTLSDSPSAPSGPPTAEA